MKKFGLILVSIFLVSLVTACDQKATSSPAPAPITTVKDTAKQTQSPAQPVAKTSPPPSDENAILSQADAKQWVQVLCDCGDSESGSTQDRNQGDRSEIVTMPNDKDGNYAFSIKRLKDGFVTDMFTINPHTGEYEIHSDREKGVLPLDQVKEKTLYQVLASDDGRILVPYLWTHVYRLHKDHANGNDNRTLIEGELQNINTIYNPDDPKQKIVATVVYRPVDDMSKLLAEKHPSSTYAFNSNTIAYDLAPSEDEPYSGHGLLYRTKPTFYSDVEVFLPDDQKWMATKILNDCLKN